MSAGFEPANVGVNAIFLTNDFRISNDHHFIAISVYQFRHDIMRGCYVASYVFTQPF